MQVDFNAEMIRRYDKAGPRYTSYPTAVAFTGDFGEQHYREHARTSNDSARPLSLYFHIPFCDTVCFYCACNKILTKNHARADAYLQYLYREMELQSALFDRGREVRQLHWGGGTPTFLNHDQISQLMDRTREMFTLLEGDAGEYSIEIDPRGIGPDTITLLRDKGFNRFSLGVQDVDERVQKAVNRVQPVEKTQSILQACRDNDARSISIDLIYGLPLQTVKGFARTLECAIGMAPDRMSVFNYAHLPHMFKPQRRINEEDLPSADEKLQILHQAIEMLTGAGYVHIGMDHFARPDDELARAQEQGTLYRNFQGYTTHADCDLAALGVSSISSLDACYSQNAKDIDGYYGAIDRGELPVVRGISLSDDDRLRRRVIQQLSCHFQLDFAPLEKAFDVTFARYFEREMADLQPMAEDGLLDVDEASIRVRPAGRLLIRNICMVFDDYLRNHQREGRFSRVI